MGLSLTSGEPLTGPAVRSDVDAAGPASRGIGPAALTGVVVAALGGPLVLAAQLVPSLLGAVPRSAGFVPIAGAVLFAAPLAVWLGYARRIAGAGGLYEFVRAAAGPRVALAQAVLWTASYALYLLYTTASIVYDVLPAVVPGVRPWQEVLEVGIPMALAGVMVAGRRMTVAVLGVIAVGQLTLVAVLAAVGAAHGGSMSAFTPTAPAGALGLATGQASLLFVCGSLPIFLGADVRRPTRTLPRALMAGVVIVAVAVAAADFPLASNPAFLRAELPGVAVAQVFVGHRLAVVLGIGVAVGIGGVMLVEFLALSRLVRAVTRQPQRRVTAALAAVLVASAPLTLINPARLYDDLLTPSLVLLWLSQLVVFAVYPRLPHAKVGGRPGASILAVAASGYALFGLYTAVTAATS